MELFKLFGSVMIDDKDAIASLNKVDKKGKTTSKKLGDMANKGLKIGAGIVAGAGVAVGGLIKMASSAADATDRIDKMSQKIGLSREGFQEWDFIMSQSGMSVDQLQMGFKTLVTQVDQAIAGTGKGAESFKKLGISVKDASGNVKTQEEIFNESVIALQNMEDGTEKAKLANDLFGRSGAEMMPLLNGAAGSVEEMKKKAHELGLVLSDETVDSGVLFTDTMDQTKRSMSALGVGIGAEVMPKIQELLEWILAHMPEIKETVSNVFDKISEVITFVTDNINILIPVLGLFLASMLALKVISIVTAIMAAWSTVTTIATAVGGAFGAVLAFITSPIGLVVLAIAGLIAIGVLLYKNWDVVKQKASQLWEGIKKAFTAVIDFVKKNWQGLLLLLLNPFAGAFKLIYDNNEKFRNTINKFVNGIKSKISNVFGKIKDVMTKPFTKAKEIIKGVIDKIKGFLSFEWKFPKLKMPHFSISNGSLNPLNWIKNGLPKIGVKWYKDGGIFSKPTLFNTPYGMKGVGEAGAEVVAPLSDLKGMINDGISRAIAPLFLNQQSSQPIVVENNILTSDGWIYKAVQRAQKREDGRYHLTKRV